MSSMRNAVQRRPHRERAQPLERRRLGLLEKHKVCPPLPRHAHIKLTIPGLLSPCERLQQEEEDPQSPPRKGLRT